MRERAHKHTVTVCALHLGVLRACVFREIGSRCTRTRQYYYAYIVYCTMYMYIHAATLPGILGYCEPVSLERSARDVHALDWDNNNNIHNLLYCTCIYTRPRPPASRRIRDSIRILLRTLTYSIYRISLRGDIQRLWPNKPWLHASRSAPASAVGLRL